MAPTNLIHKLISAGLTNTSDGLLFNFCSISNRKAAITACEESISRREKELTFLKEFRKELQEQLDQEVSNV